MKRFWIKALATCGYLSYLPSLFNRGRTRGATGAGFIGSVAGLLCVPWMTTDPRRTVWMIVGGLALAIAISDAAEDLMERVDDPRIVIDEWIGFLIAVAFLPHQWPVFLSGLLLFRIFDVWKPFGVHQAGDLPGGWGIVMDDAVAGVYANLLLQTAHGLHWI